MLQRESRKVLSTIFSKYLIKCRDYFSKNFRPFFIVKNTISLQSQLFIEMRCESKISADIKPFQEIRLNLLISTMLFITFLKLLINPLRFPFSGHLLISYLFSRSLPSKFFIQYFILNLFLFFIRSSPSACKLFLLVNFLSTY